MSGVPFSVSPKSNGAVRLPNFHPGTKIRIDRKMYRIRKIEQTQNDYLISLDPLYGGDSKTYAESYLMYLLGIIDE